MSWPTCPKSKKIIKIIEESETTLFGDETEIWSPRSDHHDNLILKRIEILLIEIGHYDKKDNKLYEKVRIIAHNLGISFWDDSETDSESDGVDEEL